MLFALLGLICVCILVGIITSRNIKDLSGFTVVPTSFFPLICTIVASFIGGGSIIGNIEKGFHHGIAPLIGFLGFPLQIILVGMFIAPKRMKALTVGDIFEQHYGKFAKIFVGVMWVIYSLGIITAMSYSMGLVLEPFIPLSRTHLTIVNVVTVVFYCYFGGIKAVVWTDVLQFLLMIIGIPLALFYIVGEFGGMHNFMLHVPDQHWRVLDNYSYAKVTCIFLGFLFGDALIPPIIQRINMAKSNREARNSFFVSAVFIVIFAAVSNLWGIGLAASNTDVSGGILNNFLMTTPFSLNVLIVLGLIAAILSSADSYLNMAAATFVNDILKPLEVKIDDLKAARYLTITFGCIALFFALWVNASVFDMLLFIYKFWGPIFLMPLIGIYFNRTISTSHFYLIAAFTVAVMAIWDVMDIESATDISSLVVGLGFNFIAYVIARRFKIYHPSSLILRSKI
ncbi:MAG: sodium:solute symporter family protein [Alphaproteobacteria bacterium]|nr:MAG: sodium:solute symporter family protein [Alphaproteobacteria bacterium]